MAAGALIGSSVALTISVVDATASSSSSEEFAAKGKDALIQTGIGAAIGAAYGLMLECVDYIGNKIESGKQNSNTKETSTTLYRSVSNEEAEDIKSSGEFKISDKGMDCKQFGRSFEETQEFGEKYNQTTIVKVTVPTSIVNAADNVNVDTTIFKSGTVTVGENLLPKFNKSIIGKIYFY